MVLVNWNLFIDPRDTTITTMIIINITTTTTNTITSKSSCNTASGTWYWTELLRDFNLSCQAN
jgi:hypothetical protein